MLLERSGLDAPPRLQPGMRPGGGAPSRTISVSPGTGRCHGFSTAGGNLLTRADMNREAMAEPTDSELWGAITEGDAPSFAELFLRHAGAVYNFCFRRTADWSVAEDLTSAVFLEAWRRRGNVRMIGDTALPWLYGVAANLLRNHRRGDRRLQAMLRRLSPPADIPDFGDDVAERLDDEMRMTALLALVEALPELDQDVFALSVWQGLSYEETATALNVPVGTVRSRLSRARRRIRELSAETGHEEGNRRAIAEQSRRHSRDG